MKAKLKTYSLIFLSGMLGASIYDLAINLKISYNERERSIICQKGIAFEQINPDATVYLKTKLECINETEKGNDNDNSTRKNSTQN